MEANLKFGALGLASEAQLGLVEGLHKLVSQEVVESRSQQMAWDWGSWRSMSGAGVVGSIRMAFERQVAAVAAVAALWWES